MSTIDTSIGGIGTWLFLGMIVIVTAIVILTIKNANKNKEK
jgi:hypothetical protein